MSEQPTASGADLARQALASARAMARTQPAKKPRTRTTRSVRTGGRDPIALGGLLSTVAVEQGWQEEIKGGQLQARWRELCPTELAGKIRPVGYDAERRLLSVVPVNQAAATAVRWAEKQLAAHLNTQLGQPAVRKIRVLPVGAHGVATEPEPTTERPPQGEPKSRETASDGYRRNRDLLLENRPQRGPTDPYLVKALARQEAAMRAHRPAEDGVVHDLETADEAKVRNARSEASRRAALAFKRGEQKNGPAVVPRAFDVA